MNIREQLHKVRYGPICNIGGDSKADNSQSVSNETQDNSIVSAIDSTNLSLNRASVGDINIQTTDHGAVDGAFNFASNMAAGAINANTHALDTVADVNRRSLTAVGSAYENSAATSSKIVQKSMDAVGSAYEGSTEMVAKAYENTNSTLADAYKTAKAGEQKILVGAVVGLVALAAIKMGSK
jgi:hypothetical protein